MGKFVSKVAESDACCERTGSVWYPCHEDSAWNKDM